MTAKGKICLTGPSRLRVAEEGLRAAGCELVMGKVPDTLVNPEAVERWQERFRS